MKMKKQLAPLLCAAVAFPLAGKADGPRLPPASSDLSFTTLAATWDEGMPLGNAIIGALVWQKGGALRMSLDHVGLWDLRPMGKRELLPERNFKWLQGQVAKKDYSLVKQTYEDPYSELPYPTKIPGGALEFDTSGLGEVEAARLSLGTALCEVKWRGGARMTAFVHATENHGWFRFENVPPGFAPALVPPGYQPPPGGAAQDLHRLGYAQGSVTTNGATIVYRQPGSEGFSYEIAVSHRAAGSGIEGVWAIVPKPEGGARAAAAAEAALKQGFAKAFDAHAGWWGRYWSKSSVDIPDPVLAKQYHNEMYKFGSAARSHSPPISLQAVWTADNGELPPWKGDYHHDLNTQLSYWPCYAGNRLDEGLGYLNWLWDVRPACRRYTSEFFGVDGLNVPGVTTLTGEQMGGWSQYSYSPTVSAWLAQHFYLHWIYSRDRDFLKARAYPYIKDVAVFLDNISVRDERNMRKLPLGSSPEIYDNSLTAWFDTITNYDLALIRFVYTAAAELAAELGLPGEAARWKALLGEWPGPDLDEQGALTFAKGFPYNLSHRHFSNIMAFHPLGLIDWGNGERDRAIITATLQKLDAYGPNGWCGYSYSWLGNAKARAMDGEGAAKALRIFAEHFCLINTFHANGDQTKQGYSGYTYRPFTLEGNMAFASGIHEMLMQGHTGTIRLFPAIPASWKNVSFENLRASGAFLVSARMTDGKVSHITIESEKGGLLRLAKPADGKYKGSGGKTLRDAQGILTAEMKPGEVLKLAADD